MIISLFTIKYTVDFNKGTPFIPCKVRELVKERSDYKVTDLNDDKLMSYAITEDLKSTLSEEKDLTSRRDRVPFVDEVLTRTYKGGDTSAGTKDVS